LILHLQSLITAGVLEIKLLKKAVDIMVCKLKPSERYQQISLFCHSRAPKRGLPTVAAGMTGLLDVPIYPQTKKPLIFISGFLSTTCTLSAIKTSRRI